MEEKKDNYSYVIASRVDDATIKCLNKLGEESGLRQSSVIRMILENARDHSTVSVTSKTDYQSMKELVREVNKIGININQIVRSANEHFYTKYEKKKLFHMKKPLRFFRSFVSGILDLNMKRYILCIRTGSTFTVTSALILLIVKLV